MEKLSSRYHAFARPAVDELKRKSVQGGVVAVCAQGAKLVLQTATMMLLARLLSAEDFGLQGMVVASTGFLGYLREAGFWGGGGPPPGGAPGQMFAPFLVHLGGWGGPSTFARAPRSAPV